MAPDVEELIKRVNTLTLDKNRLKQKLTQLTNDQNGKDAIGRLNQLKNQHSNSLESPLGDTGQSLRSISDLLGLNPTDSEQSLAESRNSSIDTSPPKGKRAGTSIAGVECATACEDDMVFINEVLRQRVEEYNDNWEFIQSKCSALLSELNALQVHYGKLKNEKLDLEEKHKKKCEECEEVKSELQTVVLNYETQLSTMSEHLSAITSRQII